MKIVSTKENDLEKILEIESKKENSDFITPNSRAEHLALIQNEHVNHLVIKSEAEEILGFIILSGITDINKNIEFRRIVIDQKGKGYGRTAIKMMKKYCFEDLKCNRLWLDVIETNNRARALYKSEGFKEEGILRECLLKNDSFVSLVIMSILEREY